MVRSKRNVKRTLSNRVKKDGDFKKNLAEKARALCHEHKKILILQFVNTKAHCEALLKRDFMRKFKNSAFLGGKNKVLQIGLGRDKADEQSKNLHLLSEQLVGQRCLLFTDASNEDILSFFNDYSIACHSKTGSKALRTVTLEPGLLHMFSHAQEPFLRRLKMVTKLTQVDTGSGVPELLVPYKVCKKGERLRPHKATLLRLLGYKDSKFHALVYCCFDKSTEKLTSFGQKGGKMVVRTKDNEDDSDIDDMTSDEEVESDDDGEFDDDEVDADMDFDDIEG